MLRLLASLLEPVAGEIEIDGRALNRGGLGEYRAQSAW
nr:hypothetical protein [Massilia mucilaginosa]